jgi:hypothetical protein
MEIFGLTEKFTDMWLQANDGMAYFGDEISLAEKKERQAYVSTFLKSMKKLQPEMLAVYSDTNVLDEFILSQIRDLFQTAFSYKLREIDLMFSTEMMGATKIFVKKARAFDPSLSVHSVFQACRNVWIMNGLQLILRHRVELTPAIFAYSMLYPYTDNFVDDPNVSAHDKLEFSGRFAERLAGKKIRPENGTERKIYELVAMIESQFDRGQFPEVYSSLLGIHHAQTESMGLLHGKHQSDEQALRICIAKGGASVLADGYLIAGNLNDEEKDFLFGYGAYLQLLDDIQDVKEDLEDGLLTSFSKAAREQKLDAIVCKTLNFGEQVLADSKAVLDGVALDFRGLLQKSILLFLIESVALDSQYYSRNFQLKIEKISPTTFSFIRTKRNFFTPKKHLLLEKLEKMAVSPEAEKRPLNKAYPFSITI